MKIIATSMVDDEVYDVMTMDVPTRQFECIVKIKESVVSREGYSNDFQFLFPASRNYVELPPPRVTVDNTADDNLLYYLRRHSAKIVVGRFTHNRKAIQERFNQSRHREGLAATS